MKKISDLVPKATAKTFRKKGFTQHEIITKWNHIVGEAIAKNFKPKSVNFPIRFFDKDGATLVVQSNPGFALELQHTQLQILERINRFFGFRAFEKIQIVQIPLKEKQIIRKETTERKTLTPQEALLLKKRLKPINSNALSHALEGLGTAVILDNEQSE